MYVNENEVFYEVGCIYFLVKTEFLDFQDRVDTFLTKSMRTHLRQIVQPLAVIVQSRTLLEVYLNFFEPRTVIDYPGLIDFARFSAPNFFKRIGIKEKNQCG